MRLRKPDKNMRTYDLAWRFYGVVRGIGRATRLDRIRVGHSTLGRRLGLVGRRFVLRTFGGDTSAPVLVHGHRMYLPPGQDFGPRFNLLANHYKDDAPLVFEQVVKPGMTILDLGGHIGFYALLGARLVGPAGKVYTFEPDPTNSAVLAKNVEINGYRNIVLVRKAVSNTTGPVKLYLDDAHTGMHSLYQEHASGNRYEVVEAATLDDFLAAEGWPQIGFIKMNIEGAEAAALEGMTRLLAAQPACLLLVEVHSGGDNAQPRNLLLRLREFGFRIDLVAPGGLLQPADPHYLLGELDRGHYFNVLCRR